MSKRPRAWGFWTQIKLNSLEKIPKFFLGSIKEENRNDYIS